MPSSALLSLGGAAFVIALTGAMAPGPLLTLAIVQAFRRGPRALWLMAGHALVEAFLLAGFAFGLQGVLRRPIVHSVLGLAGGAFLLWTGIGLLLAAVSGRLRLPTSAEGAEPERFRPVWQGAVVSVSNPYWSLWWATVGIKLAADSLAVGPLGVGAFFLGHELADVGWYGFVILAVSSGRKLLSARAYRALIGTCAAFLVVLGAGFLWEGLSGLWLR